MTLFKQYRKGQEESLDFSIIWKVFVFVLLLVVIADTYILIMVTKRLKDVEVKQDSLNRISKDFDKGYSTSFKKNQMQKAVKMNPELAMMYKHLEIKERERRSPKHLEVPPESTYLHIVPVNYLWRILPRVCFGNKTIVCFPGQKGEKGQKGNDGPTGKHGPKGNTGAKGLKGDTGQIGLPGPRGPEGRPGEQGLKGEKGEPGKELSAPAIIGPPNPVSALEGSNVTFTCEAEGNPIPKITWSFNGRSKSPRYKLIGENGLIMYQIQKDDHGEIKCTAKNIMGRQEITTNLSVLIKPRAQIVKQFGDNYEGSEAITKCSSTGFPKPILKWRKLLGSLPSTASVSDDGQTLTIKSLRKADSGTYVCSASSELGSSEVSTVLYAASIPECTSSTIIRDATRRISYGKAAKCDDGIVKKWYRFHLPGENIRMPESCTTVNKCGTHGTGWLSGKHPSVNEGIVFRTVCFSWSGNCCLNNIPIRVRNCGSFFIYELKSTSGWCSRRYCTT